MKTVAAWNRLLPLAAAWLGAAVSPAQATLTVGVGGFPQITDALAAASPGDLIVVQSGVYAPFSVSIGVRIVAPNGATITTPPGGGGLPWVHFIQPPAGQQVSIAGLTFRSNPAYPPAEPPVALRVTGHVVFADCSFLNWADYAASAVTCNGDVQFDRCTWDGVWECLTVQGGRVEANHCQLRAMAALWAPTSSSCVGASNCDLTFASCTLRGAHGVFASSSPTGAPAIRIGASTRASLADCSVYGGDSYSSACSAVVSTSAHPVLHARSLVQSGAGTLFPSGPPGPAPAFSGLEQAATTVGATAPTRPTIGAASTGAVIAPAGSLVALVLSFERTTAVSFPFAAQPIHFDPTTAAPYGFGLANGPTTWPGFGTFPWQTIALPPAFFGMQFWLHPIVWDGTTFQVGPVHGGLIY